MIQATFFKDSKGKYRGFSLLGHADYAWSGSDIICSAVTALAVNTINSIEKLTPDKDKLIYHTDEKSGLLSCSFDGEIGPESTLLVNSLLLGLDSIRKSYNGRKPGKSFQSILNGFQKKNYIKISIKEV